MNRRERAKREVLERAVSDLDAAERRVLADLRRAGFRFQSVGRARRHLAALRTLDQYKTPSDIADALIEAGRTHQ